MSNGYKITKMPDKETLEAYLSGGENHEVIVYFDIEKGEFVWNNNYARPVGDNSCKK